MQEYYHERMLPMLRLYRKRIIPSEIIPLDNDIILFEDSSCIITSWNTLRFKPEFAKGYSYYDLENNIKVSKFLSSDNKLVYWYCDILKISSDNTSYTFTDLLADVIIYPDSTYKVVDLDELSDAVSQNLISLSDLSSALRTLDNLLNMIYDGSFSRYQDILNSYMDGCFTSRS